MSDPSDNPLKLMRRTVFLSLMLAGCATASEAPVRRDAPNCAWQVCVYSTETRTGRVYRAVNREPVAATVVLSFPSLQNFGTYVGLPAERVVSPHSPETLLVRLRRIQMDRPATAVGVHRDRPGVQRHEGRYRLPVRGPVRRTHPQRTESGLRRTGQPPGRPELCSGLCDAGGDPGSRIPPRDCALRSGRVLAGRA